MEQQIFDILFNQDEITWKSLLLELVKQDNIDPCDINISTLTQRYIGMVKEMKKADLRISGKVVLAAAILLRIKSQRLLTDDIANFDNMISGSEDDLLESETPGFMFDRAQYKKLRLIPRTPQPRKRKVSIYDLLDALRRALDVEERRRLRVPKKLKLELPEKKIDLDELMTQVYLKILGLHKNKEEQKIMFSKIIPDNSKTAKIYTFVPLLHLTNQRKLDLEQPSHFGDIEIQVIKHNIDKEIEKEIPVQAA